MIIKCGTSGECWSDQGEKGEVRLNKKKRDEKQKKNS